MRVREFKPEDMDALKSLHARSGFKYELPDFADQQFVVRRVADDDGQIVMAGFLRQTTEAFLICDPHWRGPRWRYEALEAIHNDAVEQIRRMGFRSIEAFLPPQIEKRFGKRLLSMGWKHYVEEEWPCYSLEVTSG